MPFEHRNEKELIKQGGFSLVSFDKFQVGYGAETPFGKFYAVHDGEQMVQFAELQKAEEALYQFANGLRKFNE